jgi:hypothetical protein
MKRIVFIAWLLFISTECVFGQSSFLPVTVAFPQIAIGGDLTGQNFVTLMQVVNNNSAYTFGHLTLYSDSGTPLSALFDGLGPQSSLDIPLDSGQTRQIKVTLNGPVTGAWMQISYTPSDAQTTVILQFRSGTAILSEVGVNPAFSPLSATDFPAETDVSLNTGIAVANPGSTAGSVLVRLWDPSNGNLLSSAVLSLAANGHIARFLTELFPNVLSITQIRAKVSIDACSDSACNFAGGSFIATALRLNGDQFTTIPVIDRPTDGDQVRILPQVAFGGSTTGQNLKTVLYLTTNVSTGVFGTADIFDNDGNPLLASADGAAPSSSITFTVPGNRVSRIVLSGDQTLRSGWVRLTLPGTLHLIANALFQTFNGSTLVSEASVLESPAVTHGSIYVKVQSGVSDVGVAFANPQPTPNTITVKLFNQTGFPAGTRDITLPANGHLAQFVTELFPQVASLSDFDGALAMSSPTSFSALALRLSSGKIAALSVSSNGMFRPAITALRVPKTQRSPAQVNFEIDVTDFDNDIAVSSSTSVSAYAWIDFGSNGFDYGPFTVDGTPLLNKSIGTLSGSFQPPDVTGAIPSGYTAVFYVQISDSVGCPSNIITIPIKF